MRWIIATTLLVFLASAGQPLGGQVSRDRGQSVASVDDLVADMARRLDALERSQAELLARIQQLEQARDREQKALRALLEDSAPSSFSSRVRTPPSNSPLAPQSSSEDLQAEVPQPETMAVQEEPAEDGVPLEDGEQVEEPLSPAHQLIQQAETLIDEQKYQTAIRILGLAVELDPGLDEAYFYRGVARHLQGRYAEALEDFDKTIAVTGRANVIYTCLYNEACGKALLGEKEAAIQLLKESYEQGFNQILGQMSTDPDLDSLRDDPVYREFETRLRYP